MEVIGVRGLAGVRMPVLKSRRKYSSIYINYSFAYMGTQRAGS